jgi:dCTP deaminase
MMYSDTDILEAIKKGDLKVEPLFEGSVRPGGLRLHLGETILKPKPGIVADVKTGVMPEYEKIIIPEEGYLLEPGGFVLSATYEKVSIGNNIGFLIEGRSTLARLGLTIVQTAMIVYPGHTNRAVTLELANHGPNAIKLYPQMKIARVALFEMKSPSTQSYDDEGKYNKQTDVGPPIFNNEIVPLK